ncbi:hypothetical protein SLEP1_g11814 [Rubroshorea leprosula]|nr:hypothetical protein SLEP1_g11814 [Rubroshorea leprosula]
MYMDISTLEDWYLDSCRRHKVQANSAVLSWFLKAKIQKSCQKTSNIVILLDQLKDTDIPPLIDVFQAIDASDIDVVDIIQESPSILNEDYLLSLMNAVKLKLRVVDLRNTSLTKDFLRDLCHGGLSCQVLNLRSTHIQKLNMVGCFKQLQTLNLDFCTSLTSLEKDCFSCMPNLMCLSMCETRVANLWMTTASLSKLPSLVELRFQNCLCCKGTGPCCGSTGENENLAGERSGSAALHICSYREEQSTDEPGPGLHSVKESSMLLSSKTDASDADKLSGDLQRIGSSEDKNDHPKSVQNLMDVTFAGSLNKYMWRHPSPICFEKHYREYIVASLPLLEVLDNMSIKKSERETAKAIYSKYYEYLPYKHKRKKSVIKILQDREVGAAGLYQKDPSKLRQPHSYGKSQTFFSRSLSAAKLGSSAWPLLHPVANFGYIYKGESKRLRPRQFEYHPSDCSLMAFGTLDGEIVILNHENGNIVGYIPSTGAMNSVLGLCWLNKYPSKLLSGSDNGLLKLFDINHSLLKVGDTCCNSDTTYEDFEQLTSVHVNSTDDQFLVSGYSKGVALYDIGTGKRLQVFTNMHQDPINVAKFAHHSPFMFATSSFDNTVKMWDLRHRPLQPCYTASSTRGNVMVCFSPDDLYLLVSSIDNEVKQLLAVDGRLHTSFDIASTGSSQNYTRSYYMNGRDYIISGSCDEHLVRICCAQTGRRLRDVYMEDRELGNSLFVQSLRGDPFRYFHFSVLAASMRPTAKQQIIKVNLLASSHHADEHSRDEDIHPTCGLGG